MRTILKVCALLTSLFPFSAMVLAESFFDEAQLEMLSHLAQADAYNRACKRYVIDPAILDEKLRTVGLQWDDATVQSYIFFRADMLLTEQRLKSDPKACDRAYAEYGLQGSIEPELLWLPEKPQPPEVRSGSLEETGDDESTGS